MNIAQIRTIFDMAEVLVEQALSTAETLKTATTETERTAFIHDTVENALKGLEAHFNLIPDAVEGIVFKGIDFALGMIVSRVLAAAESKGILSKLPA